MAGAPKYKVFDHHGKYQAACKEIEAAANVVSFYGEGATIRMGHAKADTVWTEGADGCALDSYDVVAEVSVRAWRTICLVSAKKAGHDAAGLARLGFSEAEIAT